MIKRALCLIASICMVFSFPTQMAQAVVENPFEDVSSTSPFYKAILWAIQNPSLDNPITKGKTKTTFVPNETCTRAQILTFIWRYKGSPTVRADLNPYSDTSGEYYETAATWAFIKGYEFGEATGDGQYQFKAQTPCTRATAVTYLWLMFGRPMVSLENARVFRDLSSRDSVSLLQAVAWARQNGITNGTSETTFSPQSTCTRGQIVTFLYRCDSSASEKVSQ